MAFLSQLIEAQQRFQAELLSKKNVVGVGLGFKDSHGEPTDQMALMALVQQKIPKEALRDEDVVPSEIDGAVTDVLEVGTIQAQVNSGPRDLWRPIIPPGVSIAHYLVTAGTFGTLVYDRRTGEPLILSNNHVLAHSNDASLGDVILQPGATDGGNNPADVVAHLERYWRLRYVGDPTPTGSDLIQRPTDVVIDGNPDNASGDGCLQLIVNLGNLLAQLNNSDSRIVSTQSAGEKFDPADATSVEAQATIPENPIDAALAKPIDNSMVSNEILNIGQITGTTAPTLSMPVRKMGRTTGLTTGTITVVNTTVDVNYTTLAGNKTARFSGQVMTTGMSQGGDSGSLIVAQGNQNAVGLLFAGSGAVTVFTPIDAVLSRLNVQITPPSSVG
ncbi:MAG: hypothetical protein KC496_12055 [Anaerolineae bacterium]|nr:hypothetical protein [Anaerolineae bacterium]